MKTQSNFLPKLFAIVLIQFAVVAVTAEVKPEEAEATQQALRAAEWDLQAEGERLKAIAQSSSTTPVGIKAKAGVVAAEKAKSAAQLCDEAAETAKNFCLEKFSIHIQKGAAMASIALNMIKNMKSASGAEACEKQNEAMKISENALLLYNGACAIAQGRCSSACSASASVAKAATGSSVVAGAKVEAASNNNVKVCRSYTMNMAAAGMGLLGMIAERGKMSNCKTNTTVADCSKDPYNPACSKTMDCTKAENRTQAYCLCQMNPNSAGCAGYSGANINAPAGNVNASSGMSAGRDLPMPNDSFSDSIPVGNISSAGGAGSAGLGAGGGGAGGSGAGSSGFGVGSGAGGAKSASADGKKEKAINPNILGGFDGGGGGGGGSGSSRSTASNSDSPYKAYLPGGSRDPSAAASKLYGNGQVTGSGSKSNWQKISERYAETKSTLVGP